MPHEVDMDLLPWLVGTEAQVVERFLDLLATDVDGSSDPKSSMLADRLRALSEWAGRQQRRRLDLKLRLNIDEAVDQLVLAAEGGTLDCLATARTVVDEAIDDLEARKEVTDGE